MRSIFGRILDSSRRALVAVDGLPRVSLRKRLFVRPDERLPVVILHPLAEEYDGEEDTFENEVTLVYPVAVTIVYAGNAVLDADLDDFLFARERIRRALHKPRLEGVTEVFDCDIDLNPPFDPAGLDANLDYSQIHFKFKATEPRSE